MTAGKHIRATQRPADDPQRRPGTLESSQSHLLLNDIVAGNVDSDFGRRHDFASITSIDDYRAAVPLSRYEDIRHWVERIEAGERQVLTQGRVVAFFRTSGTLAKPKLIPVTSRLMAQKVRAFGEFWESVYRDHPGTRTGKIVCNFADSTVPDTSAAGIPVQSESSFWSMRGRGLHTRDRWPLPAAVGDIEDSRLRAYACARLLLQEDMSCIMCLNPSSLLHFCRVIEERAETLAAGLESGRWSGSETLDAELDGYAALRGYPTTDPEAARRLRRRTDTPGPFRLKSLWPSLELIICWQSRIVQPYFTLLAPFTEGVAIRDYITQSSECMMAIPTEDGVSGGALAHAAHFFEFVPEHAAGDEQPATLLAWQLEPGRRYELIASTGGGLYRYRTGDCVEVTGVDGFAPHVEFCYRLGRTSSMTGEKLTEHQVLLAARRASAGDGLQPEEFLCFPCTGTLPHYAIVADFGSGDAAPAEMKRWAAAFEHELRACNGEYADKRRSGRLGDLKLYASAAGQLRAARLQAASRGVSEEQVKSEVLTARPDLHERYPGLRPIA